MRGFIHRILGTWFTPVIDGELFGERFRAHLIDNRCEWKAFLRPDRYDPDERAFIAQHLQMADSVFVDIGANAGIHTVAAAHSAHPDSRIVAIEPHPETFRRLKFNCSLLPTPRIFPVQAAIGPTNGTVELASTDLSLSRISSSIGSGQSVPMMTLRHCLDVLGIDRIDVLKIDIEGFEDQALVPFLETAPEELLPRGIVIEIIDRRSWAVDVIERLFSMGYREMMAVGNNSILERGPAAQ